MNIDVRNIKGKVKQTLLAVMKEYNEKTTAKATRRVFEEHYILKARIDELQTENEALRVENNAHRDIVSKAFELKSSLESLIEPNKNIIAESLLENGKSDTCCELCDQVIRTPNCEINDDSNICLECGKLKLKYQGEQLIYQYLRRLNIGFHTCYEFVDCTNPVTKSRLKMDFYVPQFNLVIEYDGRPHFEEIEYFGGSIELERIVFRDKIKNSYTEENNINLLRIPFGEIKVIGEILDESIRYLKKGERLQLSNCQKILNLYNTVYKDYGFSYPKKEMHIPQTD